MFLFCSQVKPRCGLLRNAALPWLIPAGPGFAESDRRHGKTPAQTLRRGRFDPPFDLRSEPGESRAAELIVQAGCEQVDVLLDAVRAKCTEADVFALEE